MSETGLLIIKTVCNSLAGLFLVLGALCVFWGKWQHGRHEKTREWFRNKWSVIGSSRWLTMPETVICWVLDTRTRIAKKIPDWWNTMFETVWGLAVTVVVVFLAYVAFWHQWGSAGFIIFTIIGLPMLVMTILETLTVSARGPLAHVRQAILKSPVFIGAYGLSFGALLAVGATIWLLWLLRFETIYAVFATILLIPVYWMFILWLVVVVERAWEKASRHALSENAHKLALPFSIAVAASFSVTLLALLLGHAVYPDLWVPKTFQMLISNVLCDGFTLLTTFWILGWAVAKKGLFRIPAAILLDIVVAALLACCSLYFGLVFTEHGLSPVQVLRVLIGKSPDGSGLEFGPYFWAMHTTFIPTLLYLFLIGVCWMAKVVLTVAAKFTKKALEHEKPCELTAALFGILFAVFTALSLTLGSAEDWLDKHKPIEPPVQTVVEPNQVGND